MIKFDGTLAGVEGSAGSWSFEGVEYNTPAKDGDLISCVGEALSAPDEREITLAHKLMFNTNTTYTSQTLLALMAAYEREVGIDGDGTPQILAILQEAARRIACIEALTI